jgi:hypothetical protein
MPDHAGSTQIRYETPNALGALWQLAPRLAARCIRLTNYAKAIQTYLRAIDFYCQQHAISPSRVKIDTFVGEGRIIQRISR